MTRSTASRFDLGGAGASTRLSGEGRFWAGVIRGGGSWSFATDGSGVASGTVYYRPRYEWVLHAPERIRVRAGDNRLTVQMYLLSLEEDQPVDAGKVFPNLPMELPCTFRLPGEAGERRTAMVRTQKPEALSPAYEASFDLEDATEGAVEITVDLDGMARDNFVIRRAKLSGSVELRPFVRIVVRDAKGRETAIHVEKIPIHGAWLREWWSRSGTGR